MKKYKQLVIICFAIFGSIGFFVYRYNYVKLRSTFEIFDIMGGERDPYLANCLVLNETIASRDTKSFSMPNPIWTKVGQFYVYSAFGENIKGKYRIKSIGVGNGTSNADFSCHIWYNHRNVILSNTGMFSYNFEDVKNSNMKIVEFVCEDLDKMKGTPYMFVFIDNISAKKYFIPIYFRVFKDVIKNSSAVCTYPEMTGMSKTLMIEFLSYHQVIGFTDMIIYDSGIHYGILDKMKQIVRHTNAFHSISVLTWNFPFDDYALAKLILEKDCIYRTANQVELTILLGFDDYLIPKTLMSNTNQFFQKYQNQVNTKVKLTNQICCTEKHNTKTAEKSWPILLKKTYCIKHSDFKFVVINPRMEPIEEPNDYVVSNVAVSTYDNCGKYLSSPVFYDPSALNFVSNLMASKMLRLWKSGTFFD